MFSFPVLRTRLPVCFLSPFPDSLPQLFLRCLPCAFAFGLSPSNLLLSSASLPVLATWPLLLPFLFLPVSPSQWVFFGAPLPLSLLWFSPFFPTWFPMSSLPVLRTRLSVCFLSSFLASLPQLFHQCFPFARAFGLSPHFTLSFVRFRLVLTTWPSVLSFPFFPFSPDGGSSGASFLFRLACFHAFLPILVLSFSAFPFSVRCLASQWLPQRLSLLPFGFRPLPLGFRFRFWLLSLRYVSLTDTPYSLLFCICIFAANFYILPLDFLFVNYFF